jgi:ribosomal protein L24
MHGAKRGSTGKVLSVSLRTGKITVDTIKRKTAKGKEYHIPVYASNVYITDLNLSDKVRARKLNVAVQAKKEAKPQLASEMKPTVQKPVEIKGEVPAQAITK